MTFETLPLIDQLSNAIRVASPDHRGADLAASPRLRPSGVDDLDRCLQDRRSARGFDDRPIARAALAALVAETQQAVASSSPCGVQPTLQSMLVVWSADDVEPGSYLVGEGLERVGDAPAQTGLDRLFVSVPFESAAAALVLFVDLRGLRAASYRQLLVRAGFVAHSVHMVATAGGIGSRIVHAVVGSTLRRSIPPGTTARARPLLGVAFGSADVEVARGESDVR